MAKLRVYSANYGYAHQVVAAPSKAAAVRALDGTSMYEFNMFWGETVNDESIAIAMSNPGKVFHIRNHKHGGTGWHDGGQYVCGICRRERLAEGR